MSTSVFFSKPWCFSVFRKCLKDRDYNVHILPFCFSISYYLKDKTKTGFALCVFADLVFVRIFHLICARRLQENVRKTYISNTPTHEEIKLANY